ncbi:MAG: YceI family protein, partial [Acidobacteria bacterium]|nr:YceI family protein [Acidobacteriota bacterium]
MLRATNWTLSVALWATLPGLAQVSDWQIDSAHTAAQFSVRHMMVSNVRGSFGKTTGSARFDPKDPAKASVEASV